MIVITKQGGFGRGLFSLQEFYNLNDWMFSRFEKRPCSIDLLLASTLDPNQKNTSSRELSFRKPAPGLLPAAQELLNLDIENSLIIGDIESNMEAGLNARVKNRFLVNPETISGGHYGSFYNLSACLIRLRDTF